MILEVNRKYNILFRVRNLEKLNQYFGEENMVKSYLNIRFNKGIILISVLNWTMDYNSIQVNL